MGGRMNLKELFPLKYKVEIRMADKKNSYCYKGQDVVESHDKVLPERTRHMMMMMMMINMFRWQWISHTLYFMQYSVVNILDMSNLWKMSILFSLFKNASEHSSQFQYQTLCLLSVISKSFEDIIINIVPLKRANFLSNTDFYRLGPLTKSQISWLTEWLRHSTMHTTEIRSFFL